MIYHVVALHKTDPTIVLWYTGQPGAVLVSESKDSAQDFPDELKAQRVVKRLNEYTKLHGYTFCTVARNCEIQHIVRKLTQAMLRSEVTV
jgi:hypothetical protein